MHAWMHTNVHSHNMATVCKNTGGANLYMHGNLYSLAVKCLKSDLCG